MATATLVSTVCDRPGYTRQLLEALSQCYGVSDYSYWAFAEPGNPEVLEQLYWARDEGFFRECHAVTNKDRLYARRNMHQALTRGFAETDRVIVLEDDCIPAPDMLRYFEWALDEYERDAEIFSITGYHRPERLSLTDEQLAARAKRDCAVVSRKAWFHPWGWATWLDRWAKVRYNWALPGRHWDICILRYIQRNSFNEIYPIVARVKNIAENRPQHQNFWGWAGNWELPEIHRWQEER